MTFRDDLKAAITKARKENAQEEQEERTFADTWEALRTTGPLFKRLKEAEAVLTEERIGGYARLDNGGIVLEAVWNESRQHDHYLRFSPKAEARQVACSSSIKELEEPYSLHALTEEVIRAKVERFVYAIIRGKKAKAPAGLIR